MFPVFEIGWLLLTHFFLFVIHPFFWVLVGVVILMTRQTIRMEERLLGLSVNNTWQQVYKSILLGIPGGFIASIILITVGLSLDSVGIIFLLSVAILLLMLNPRFFCFAYAGGVVSLMVFAVSALIGVFPALIEIEIIKTLAGIHLPSLLALVAILHLIESLLIFIGGHWGSSPVFFKTKSGEILGGFSLQRVWPIPLIGMVAILQPDAAELLSQTISMPDWWPILKAGPDPVDHEALIYFLIPVIAGLGYADFALSSSPREKSIISARYLGIYSIVLLALAVLAEYYPFFLFAACLFAPIGHEMVVISANRLEFNRSPLFKAPEDGGVKILGVYPYSAAMEAGLQSGDIVRQVNNIKVTNIHNFWELLQDSYFLVYLTVERRDESLSVVLQKNGGKKYMERYSRASKKYPGRPPLFGLILVPETTTPIYMEIKKISPLGALMNRFR